MSDGVKDLTLELDNIGSTDPNITVPDSQSTHPKADTPVVGDNSESAPPVVEQTVSTASTEGDNVGEDVSDGQNQTEESKKENERDERIVPKDHEKILQGKEEELKFAMTRIQELEKSNKELQDEREQILSRGRVIEVETKKNLATLSSGIAQLPLNVWCDVFEKVNRLSVECREIDAVRSEMIMVKARIENVKKDLKEERQKTDALSKEKGDLMSKREGLKQRIADLECEKESFKQQSEQYKKNDLVLKTALGYMKPKCLVCKDWFSGFYDSLIENVIQDCPSDPAMLLFASLAEFAVMERHPNPSELCFGWEKQLVDIGCVLSRCLRSNSGLVEKDIRKWMNEFASALVDCPPVKDAKIGIKVPSIGEGVDTSWMCHLNNGNNVNKVLNWCVVNPTGIYKSAEVE